MHQSSVVRLIMTWREMQVVVNYSGEMKPFGEIKKYEC